MSASLCTYQRVTKTRGAQTSAMLRRLCRLVTDFGQRSAGSERRTSQVDFRCAFALLLLTILSSFQDPGHLVLPALLIHGAKPLRGSCSRLGFSFLLFASSALFTGQEVGSPFDAAMQTSAAGSSPSFAFFAVPTKRTGEIEERRCIEKRCLEALVDFGIGHLRGCEIISSDST